MQISNPNNCLYARINGQPVKDLAKYYHVAHTDDMDLAGGFLKVHSEVSVGPQLRTRHANKQQRIRFGIHLRRGAALAAAHECGRGAGLGYRTIPTICNQSP